MKPLISDKIDKLVELGLMAAMVAAFFLERLWHRFVG
jgi:hypothetical protein